MPDQDSVQERAVIALAGRRIDAAGTDPARFPLGAVPLVRQRLADLLRREGADAIVCSAACGADLVALEVAGQLGLRRRMVLPFAPERFRGTSVTDRPGNWGAVFDGVLAAVVAEGGLMVLDGGADSGAAYAAANRAIIREAQAIAQDGPASCRLVAVVVWEGAARSGTDATDGFRQLAAKAGFDERTILTR